MTTSHNPAGRPPLDRAVLVAQNADVLRALADLDGIKTRQALAQKLGKDASNLAKTFERLQREGLIGILGSGLPTLTGVGEAELAKLDGATAPAAPSAITEGSAEISLALIDNDPALNPRTTFDEADLDALAASIVDKGLLQPILVRPSAVRTDGRFRVVAGERRWRAAQRAMLATIPAIVRDLNDAEALEVALIENIQRSDMHPLEEARAFRRVIDGHKTADATFTEADGKKLIAEKVKRTVRFVEDRLYLLKLPEAEQLRLTLPGDDPKHLGLKQAREMLQGRLDREQKLAALPYSADAWLMLAEIMDAAGWGPSTSYWSAETEVRGDVDDLDLGDLKTFRLVCGPNFSWETGRLSIRLDYMCTDACERLVNEGFMRDRAACLANLRKAAGAAGTIEGAYATPWLNGPFEVTAANQARLDARVREIEEARARQDATNATMLAAQAEREVLVAEVRADATGEAGSAGNERLARLLEAVGITLPVVVGHYNRVEDAHGRSVVELSWNTTHDEAACLAIAVAINSSVGLATPRVPPLARLSEDAFLAAITDRLTAHETARITPAMAREALDRFLQDGGVDYGAADCGVTWNVDQANEIADGFIEDLDPDEPGSDDGADVPPYLARLAGGQPSPAADDDAEAA
jgi:ParB/RepB/Spo0J family partition protein